MKLIYSMDNANIQLSAFNTISLGSASNNVYELVVRFSLPKNEIILDEKNRNTIPMIEIEAIPPNAVV